MGISNNSGITLLENVSRITSNDGTVAITPADGTGAVDLSTSTSLAAYIRRDGLTTTTALIPFAEGISVADTKKALIGGSSVALARGGIYNDNTILYVKGYQDSSQVNGANIIIQGGDGGVADSIGGILRLHGGNYGVGGDTFQNGFVTTDTTITSFTLSSAIVGSTTIGNTIEDFAVGGNQYNLGCIATANGIGTNGAVLATGSYSLLAEGNAARIIGVDRKTTGAGVNLTIQSGWAQNGSTNQASGTLVLAPGKATGTGVGNVLIQAVGGGLSGTTDRSPVDILQFGSGTATFSPTNYSIACANGLQIASKASEKLAFFGATPIAQQANSVSIETLLSNYGLRPAGSAAPITIGVFSSTSTTDSTSNSTGGGKFSGGVGIVKNLFVGGNISCDVAGKGFAVKEGSNAKMGTGTLVGGTATISTTAVTASSRIFLTDTGGGINIGSLYVGTVTAGASFIVNSTNALDTSTFNWIIFEPS